MKICKKINGNFYEGVKMIIYGSRNRQKRMGISENEVLCNYCKNETQFEIITQREYFTLYFIPLFPIGKRREYMVCPVCNRYYEQTK